MQTHSQDSIESQVQKLEQRAKLAEQTLFGKNAEVQAAQRKLTDLEEQFKRKTARLLEEEQVTLDAEAKSLRKAVMEQRKLFAEAKKDTIEGEIELSTVLEEIVLAQEELKSVVKEIEIAKDNIVATRKEQAQADNALIAIRNQAIMLEQSVSKLTTEENRLLGSISSKESALYELEQRLVQATEVFETAKTDREENIRQLDAKLLYLTNEIQQNSRDEDVIRQELADRMRELDARDQNLRVREAKVEEGESKIIRNSNLMNL